MRARPALRLRDLILDHWRFRAWNLPRDEVREVLGPDMGAQACMDELARRYTRSLGADECHGWVEHTPFNTSNIHVLDDHFEDARYINVVRDGRAVAASILRTDFGPTTVRGAAMWWQAHVLPGLAASYREPERVLLVRYEDLLLRPEESRARIVEFLGRPDPDARPVPVRVDPLFRDTHRLVGEPGDRSRVDAWKESLKPAQIEAFEAIAGGSLFGLGYELLGERAPEPRRVRRYLDQVVDAALQVCWQFPRRSLNRRLADVRRPSPSRGNAPGESG